MKLVCLVPCWLESVFVEAKVVVFFTGVGALAFGYSAADIVWVSEFVEGSAVRRLEVVVHHSSLFLLF
jgi:hypothetical protein